MERESDYDNDGLDPSEEYFRKNKKIMMKLPISLQKNQNYHITRYIDTFKNLRFLYRNRNFSLSETKSLILKLVL